MIAQAIYNLAPTAVWSMTNDSYDELVWLSDGVAKPSKDAVLAEVARLQAEYDAKQYQRDRVAEYPSIQEQMDMQYWDAINGTTTWQDAINAVKTKYPKGA
jgi:hypothetical protein